jgi:hypothetical protein
LTTTGVATTFEEAQRLSRQAAESVQFEGKTFRRDIGWREACACMSEAQPRCACSHPATMKGTITVTS